MDANQLITAVGEAVAAAKPAQEICLRWVPNDWWSCMTKGEWSGWMQAVGSLIGLMIAIGVPLYIQRRDRGAQKEIARMEAGIFASEFLVNANKTLAALPRFTVIPPLNDAMALKHWAERAVFSLGLIEIASNDDLRAVAAVLPVTARKLVQARSHHKQLQLALQLLPSISASQEIVIQLSLQAGIIQKLVAEAEVELRALVDSLNN